MYRFDADSYTRNLTRITEDSHEEEILRKNNRRLMGRNSMYARNSNNLFLANAKEQESKSRAVRYLDKIDKNEIKTSLDRIKQTTIPKIDTPYSISHQTIQRSPLNDRYIDVDESFNFKTFGDSKKKEDTQPNEPLQK